MDSVQETHRDKNSDPNPIGNLLSEQPQNNSLEKPEAPETNPEPDLLDSSLEDTSSDFSDTEMAQIIQLKIILRDITPPIWRRIQIPTNYTFKDLHCVMQQAMGWQTNHTHMYYAGENNLIFSDLMDKSLTESGQPNNFKDSDVELSEYLKNPGDFVVYEYDLGDSWQHDVVLEKFVSADLDDVFPKCVGGRRAAPPDDCGGVEGYERLLEIMGDVNHPEHEEMKEWLEESYPDFDPEKFDKESVFTFTDSD